MAPFRILLRELLILCKVRHVELDMAVPTYLEVKEIIGLGLTEAVFRLFPQASREQVFQLQTSYSRTLPC